jgi:DNA polymerase-1
VLVGEREVALLEQLFLAMRGRLDFPRAILRGRYLIATGRIEAAGIPIDSTKFDAVKRHWRSLRGQLSPALRDAKPEALGIGEDSRHRAELRPFSSRTGRNQPSTAQFMLAAPGWLRQLIKPESGRGLVMADWAEQEFGVAAALSGDQRMMAEYRSGDSYSAFADRYGADDVPSGRSDQRNTFKACALGVLNGIGSSGLARQIGCSLADARHLLLQHRAEYAQFWRWSDAVEMRAYLHGRLQSVFGWGVAVNPDSNPRFVRNFPTQANGAEMLRLACCLATEKGVTVCAPSHDALLIEAPLADLPDAISVTEAAMAEASEIVLDGFPLRTSVKSIRYPDQYPHPRSDALWSEIDRALAQFEETCEPARERNASCVRAHPRPISSYVSSYFYSGKDQSNAND